MCQAHGLLNVLRKTFENYMAENGKVRRQRMAVKQRERVIMTRRIQVVPGQAGGGSFL